MVLHLCRWDRWHELAPNAPKNSGGLCTALKSLCAFKTNYGLEQGISVNLEDGAGDSARFANDMYTSSGAKIVDRNTALGSDIVLKVRPPSLEEVSSLKRG